ncbi:hypothetical protein PG984_002245 [Apiospora sp. TS-2023a]
MRVIRQVPMRNTYQNYNLSGLILDLDAEGNKHVRKYDPKTDGVPDLIRTVHNYEQVALKRRVQGFEDRYSHYSKLSDYTSAQEYNSWHVSDIDIISSTLLGPSSRVRGEQSRINDTASSIFEEITDIVHQLNGIPRHAQEDVARGVPYLMHRQKKHKKTAADPDVPLFARRIQECENLTELRRVIQNLLARPGGCKLIGPYSLIIAGHCKKLESTMSRDELKDLAVFINDVTIKLSSEKVPIPSHLAGIGLRIAASHGAFPAMQMYFAVTGTWKQKHMSLFVNQALERTLLFLTWQSGHDKGQHGAQEARASRVAAYTTLTGYSMSGYDYRSAYQKVVRTQESDPLSHHRHFLHILGELGAFRTMWHIFQKSIQEGVPLIPFEFHLWFVTAVLRARHNVQSGRITFAPESVGHGTGDYEADCNLDLQTIMSSSMNAGSTETTGSNDLRKLAANPSLGRQRRSLEISGATYWQLCA